jgi:hypothetical protein
MAGRSARGGTAGPFRPCGFGRAGQPRAGAPAAGVPATGSANASRSRPEFGGPAASRPRTIPPASRVASRSGSQVASRCPGVGSVRASAIQPGVARRPVTRLASTPVPLPGSPCNVRQLAGTPRFPLRFLEALARAPELIFGQPHLLARDVRTQLRGVQGLFRPVLRLLFGRAGGLVIRSAHVSRPFPGLEAKKIFSQNL